ncbi:unnamed protein product [Rotaria magnacalcarata]|uniref:CCHC-type domain-containing protein n=1 Tax=Rotaria magnacalcarata TaxID=392030 RepID=A0A816T1H5_9BILA|nr:unnamed protein product [Rotaria magnacalcarata]CAF4053223.1 unnamed protein product [Rotaria magnacalcarata]
MSQALPHVSRVSRHSSVHNSLVTSQIAPLQPGTFQQNLANSNHTSTPVSSRTSRTVGANIVSQQSAPTSGAKYHNFKSPLPKFSGSLGQGQITLANFLIQADIHTALSAWDDETRARAIILSLTDHAASVIASSPHLLTASSQEIINILKKNFSRAMPFNEACTLLNSMTQGKSTYREFAERLTATSIRVGDSLKLNDHDKTQYLISIFAKGINDNMSKFLLQKEFNDLPSILHAAELAEPVINKSSSALQTNDASNVAQISTSNNKGKKANNKQNNPASNFVDPNDQSQVNFVPQGNQVNNSNFHNNNSNYKPQTSRGSYNPRGNNNRGQGRGNQNYGQAQYSNSQSSFSNPYNSGHRGGRGQYNHNYQYNHRGPYHGNNFNPQQSSQFNQPQPQPNNNHQRAIAAPIPGGHNNTPHNPQFLNPSAPPFCQQNNNNANMQQATRPPGGEIICYECGISGHLRPQCAQFHAWAAANGIILPQSKN